MRLAERAAELDAADPCAGLRERFVIPDGTIYAEAHSLGAPQRHTADRLAEVVRTQWGHGLIDSWKDGWWNAPERVGDRIAAVVGAPAGSVVVGESTSTTLFGATVGAVRANPGRSEILVDAGTFPTDRYIATSAARMTGHTVRAVPGPDLASAVNEHTAVLLADHSNFRTAQLQDLTGLAAAAHEAGAWLVADLSHSAGALPVDLAGTRVDVAVGATYKYLSGGPGSPAFCFVRPDRLAAFDPPLTGWHGHREPWAMVEDYTPAEGITRMRSGTPAILALLALDAALDVWEAVSITEVRAKSLGLTGLFMDCVDELLGGRMQVRTPRSSNRGGHVGLACADAEAVQLALKTRGVLVDMRPPDLLRVGFGPLWTSYRQALQVAEALSEVLAEGS